ncbi:MAG: GHKL domain-containing protein [Sphingomonadales bacterium]|nr:GHKL domain-containing protein [Sphingomonadales bacterium]
MKLVGFVTRAIDPLLLVPAGEWREIFRRAHVRRLAQACLVFGMFISWATLPAPLSPYIQWTESIPDLLDIALLATLLWFITVGHPAVVYLLPMTVLAINGLYCTFNTVDVFVPGAPFDVRTVYYSLIYFIVNSIMFNQVTAFRLNLLVFLVCLSTVANQMLGRSVTVRADADPELLVGAIALSAGGLLTQHLVLAIRVLGLERLADARVRMAEMQGERQIAEERLAASEERARLNRITVLEAMSSSIAHEINQPISAALTYANAAQRWLSRPAADVEEALRALGGAITEIDSVGQRVLTIRQLSSRQTRQYQPTDLPALVQSQVRLVRSEFARRGIYLALRCDRPDALRAVRTCAPDVGQVVMNLLSNALEAFETPVAAAAVQIELAAQEPNWVEIRVIDNGSGIAPEQFGTIFQAFHTTKAGGTGLGLAICREIAERHAGSLVLESVPGGGTMATLRLPIDA